MAPSALRINSIQVVSYLLTTKKKKKKVAPYFHFPDIEGPPPSWPSHKKQFENTYLSMKGLLIFVSGPVQSGMRYAVLLRMAQKHDPRNTQGEAGLGMPH